MNGHDVRKMIAEGRLNRRDFGRLLASAGLATVSLPIAAGHAAAARPTYFTWAGYEDPDLFPGYMEKYKEGPEISLFADEQEALSKLRAGFSADVAHPCSEQIARWREAGVLKQIDTGRLSHWPDLFESLRAITGDADGGPQWFVPIDWGSASIVYRTDLVENPEESWQLLWDERYSGRLAIGEQSTDTMRIAGLVAGVPKENLFDMSDAEIAQVAEALRKQRPLLRFYWSDNTTMEQALASGEIVASSAWNSSYVALKQQGVPVAYMQPKEGILTWCCGVVVTAAATNLDAAYDLIDAMIAPDAGQQMITKLGYGHSNRKTFDMVGEQELADRGLPKDPTDFLAAGVFSRENKRLADLEQMFSEVKGGF